MLNIKGKGLRVTKYTYRLVVEASHKSSLTEKTHRVILDDELEDLDIQNLTFINDVIEGIESYWMKLEGGKE